MIKKEELYKLIVEIPDEELNSALRYLQFLRDPGEDPVITALNTAALDVDMSDVRKAVEKHPLG